MNKIFLCVLGLPFGLFTGMWSGTWIERAVFGPGAGGHMNMSGIFGAFVGMFVGAVIGGFLGLHLGAACDQFSGSHFSMARVKRISIAAAIGTGLGLPFSLSAHWSTFHADSMIVGAWLGCLSGCLWNVFAKPAVDDGSIASRRP